MENITFSIQKESGNINFPVKDIPYLKEDESFLFSIKAPVSYGEPILSLQDLDSVAIFAKACFGHPSLKQAAKNYATI